MQTRQPEHREGLAGRERSDHTVRQDERAGSLIANAHSVAVNVQARYLIDIKNTGSLIIEWLRMSSEVSAR